MKIQPGVLAVFAESGQVNVVVALAESATDSAADMTTRRSAIARLQAQVLEQLSAEDFRNGIRFEFVPAISGTILSKRAFEILERHPAVRRVDADPGGRGAKE